MTNNEESHITHALSSLSVSKMCQKSHLPPKWVVTLQGYSILLWKHHVGPKEGLLLMVNEGGFGNLLLSH